MSELVVLLERREVGLVRHARGRLTFVYADAWRDARGAYPLSLSLPLAAAEHKHAAIEPFLWGLLPDNDIVLERWAKRFQVSARSAFSLLSHVGEDCAGAVQFARPERQDELLGDKPSDVEWLTEAEVAERLRALQRDVSASRSPNDTGQFSLAGAQPKTALLFDGRRWGVPSGREPTTHILKPPTSFDGHAENEQLCLMLAGALGLPTAHSEVRQFEDVNAIVVERYDRVRSTERASKTQTYRVHQEDFCQALQVHPSRKYQNEGGPGPKHIVDMLRTHTSGPRQDEDIATFVDALILNWLIGGTDAHAKNYSILIGAGGVVRLAPLYDIASIFAYPDINADKAKLAMKIGPTYRLRDIGVSAWRKLAAELRVDADAVIERARALAHELPDRLSAEIRRLRKAGVAHVAIDNLAKTLPERAKHAAQM